MFIPKLVLYSGASTDKTIFSSSFLLTNSYSAVAKSLPCILNINLPDFSSFDFLVYSSVIVNNFSSLSSYNV